MKHIFLIFNNFMIIIWFFLDERGNGTFLVRESSSSSGDYVLSVLHKGQVIHYQIRKHGEDAFFSIGRKLSYKFGDNFV